MITTSLVEVSLCPSGLLIHTAISNAQKIFEFFKVQKTLFCMGLNLLDNVKV